MLGSPSGVGLEDESVCSFPRGGRHATANDFDHRFKKLIILDEVAVRLKKKKKSLNSSSAKPVASKSSEAAAVEC